MTDGGKKRKRAGRGYAALLSIREPSWPVARNCFAVAIVLDLAAPPPGELRATRKARHLSICEAAPRNSVRARKVLRGGPPGLRRKDSRKRVHFRDLSVQIESAKW